MVIPCDLVNAHRQVTTIINGHYHHHKSLILASLVSQLHYFHWLKTKTHYNERFALKFH